MVGLRSLLPLALAALAAAQYDDFFFTSNATQFRCPRMFFDCTAPSACAHDAVIDKYYCCGAGTGAVCYEGSTDCSGGDDETAGTGQLDCGSYCCLSGRETCTQRRNQINICWASAPNPFANVTEARMNRTFSSLSAAQPAATQYDFNLRAVTAPLVNPNASPTASPTTSTPSASATASIPAIANPPSNNSLSGGAIAGIVIGVVAALALLALGAFFIGRRARRNKTAATAPPTAQVTAYQGSGAGGAGDANPNEHAYGELGGQGVGHKQYYDAKYAPVPQDAAPAEMYAGPDAAHELPSKP